MLDHSIDSAHICPALRQAGFDRSDSPNQGRVSEKDDAAAGLCDSKFVRAGHGGHAKRCHGLAAAGALRFGERRVRRSPSCRPYAIRSGPPIPFQLWMNAQILLRR